MDWSILPTNAYRNVLDEWEGEGGDGGVAHPLLHADFLESATTWFADERTRVLVARDGQKLQLVLPIQQVRFGTCQTFSPSQLPICPLRIRCEIDELAGYLRNSASIGARSFMLGLLHYDEKYLPPIDLAALSAEQQPYCTTMSIDARLRFSDYWSKRSKKLRDNIKRYAKRAAKAGHTVTVRKNRSPDDLASAFERYAEIEAAGWKGKMNTAIRLENQQGRFYADMLQRFAARGQACVHELLFNDIVVSSRISIQSGAVVVFLKTTYDEEYSSFSPGRLLLHHALEDLVDDASVDDIEFYTKASRDQAQWATAQREIRHVTCYRAGWMRSAVRRLRSARARVRSG